MGESDEEVFEDEWRRFYTSSGQSGGVSEVFHDLTYSGEEEFKNIVLQR